MCGIAGFIGLGTLPARGDRVSVLREMCRRITHRGPDDEGYVVDGEIAFGMRRLAIIDIQGGHQPMSNEDGSITIIFNGEIYNYLELQTRLGELGHRFHTNSDTETIIHAYEVFGEACVEQLRGMFAFAIWDKRKRKLFLARDRVGKKPLYYTITPQGTLVFGSELKCLLAHPEVTREVNPEALDAYLTFGYVPDDLCIFRNCHKLAAGHHLSFSEDHLTLKQYWDFGYMSDEESSRKAEDYLDELRELLDEAVRIRLISDVPLGAFLSGGVDSSAVVGLMARHSTQPVKTFSIGFHEDSHDELKFARLAAQHFGTEHHEFVVTPDICQIVDEVAWHFDEPFADASALPTYMVSKLAREHVTVALSGDGGDELFAGYTRYLVERKRDNFGRIPAVLRKKLMLPVSQALPHSTLGRNFLHNIALDAPERFLDSVSVFTELTRKALYTRNFRAQLKHNNFASDRFRSLAQEVRAGNPLDALLYIDSKTYLPGDILTKVDRMSMAASLEARAPLLDHKLIDFVSRVPSSLKLQNFETKHILKKAIADFVPAEILHRKKQGFGLPIQQWINRELHEQMHDTLLDPRTSQRGYVEPSYVRRLLKEHEEGRRDHSGPLWTLFMLELWYRLFADHSKTNLRPEREAEAIPISAS